MSCILCCLSVTNPLLVASSPLSPTSSLNLPSCPSLLSSILHSPLPPLHHTTRTSSHSSQLWILSLLSQSSIAFFLFLLLVLHLPHFRTLLWFILYLHLPLSSPPTSSLFLTPLFPLQTPQRSPVSEITWPSALSVPRHPQCPHTVSLHFQRSLDQPEQHSPRCAAHPSGRHARLHRSYSTQV